MLMMVTMLVRIQDVDLMGNRGTNFVRACRLSERGDV